MHAYFQKYHGNAAIQSPIFEKIYHTQMNADGWNLFRNQLYRCQSDDYSANMSQVKLDRY